MAGARDAIDAVTIQKLHDGVIVVKDQFARCNF